MSVEIKECRHGRMMFLANDIYMGKMLSEYGEYSEEEVDLFKQLVRHGDIVIEAGSNIGCHTIPLAKIVGPEGLLLAFEPQRTLYHMLCGNLALNGLSDRVLAFWAAVGDRDGTVAMPAVDYDASSNFGGISVVPGDRVRLGTIDHFALGAVRLIKADVEGMEAEVLLGAKETIARCRPLIYVENDRPKKSELLLEILADMSYRAFHHAPRYLPSGNRLFPDMVSLNVLGIPREMDVVSINLEEIM
jgi:FkbM family methyltransferase